MEDVSEDEIDKIPEESNSCEIKSPLNHRLMFKTLENQLRRMVIKSIGESGKTKEDILKNVVISESQLDFQLDYLVKECYAEVDGTIFRLNEKGKDELLANIVMSAEVNKRRTNMEKLEKNKIEELMNIYNLAGKKICIQPLISNDEIGYQCIIVIMSLYDDNDISNVLHKTGKEKMKRIQNRILGLLHTKDEKLKNEFANDLETLDALSTMLEDEFGPKSNIDNKCRCFILSLGPDQKVDLRRMDTDEHIDIKDINGLFDVLRNDKYDFIY